MKNSVSFIAWVLAGILVAAIPGAASPAQAAADPVGYQFLDRLVALYVKAGAPGSVAGNIGPDLLTLAKDLKAAQAAKRVDDLFAIRYSRLLSAVRQALLTDSEVLYWPFYRYTMMDFVEERTGHMPDWKDLLFIVNDHGGSGVGLGFLADAVISEVVSLHIHLENLAKRPEILKGYLERGMRAAGVNPDKDPRSD